MRGLRKGNQVFPPLLGIPVRLFGNALPFEGKFKPLGLPFVPHFDGAFLLHESKDALWARFFTGAPRRLRRSVERYSIVKRARERSPDVTASIKRRCASGRRAARSWTDGRDQSNRDRRCCRSRKRRSSLASAGIRFCRSMTACTHSSRQSRI